MGFFPFLKYLFGCNVLVIIIIEKEGKKGHHHAVPDPATVKKSQPFSRTQPIGATLPPRIPLDRVYRTQSSPEVSQASEIWVNCGLHRFSCEDPVSLPWFLNKSPSPLRPASRSFPRARWSLPSSRLQLHTLTESPITPSTGEASRGSCSPDPTWRHQAWHCLATQDTS